LDRREGRPERATQLFGAAQALRERLGLNVTPEYAAEHESETTALRDLLGQAAFDAAWSAGRALTLEQAVALALQGELGE